jgi:hypothetical protein
MVRTRSIFTIVLSLYALVGEAQHRCGDVVVFCRVFKEFANNDWHSVRREDYVNWTMYYQPDVTYGAAWNSVNNQWSKTDIDSLGYDGVYVRYENIYNDTAWQPAYKTLMDQWYAPNYSLRLGWNGTDWDTLEKFIYTYSGPQTIAKYEWLYNDTTWVPFMKWEYGYTWSSLQSVLQQRWDTLTNQWLDDAYTGMTYVSSPYGAVAENLFWSDSLSGWQNGSRIRYGGDYNLPDYEVREDWLPATASWVATDSIANGNLLSLGNNARIASIHFISQGGAWLPWRSDSACYEMYGGVASLDTPSLFTLYPNPADGFITLSTSSNRVIAIQIIDVMGRMLVEKIVRPGESVVLDLKKINAGVYTATDSGLASRRFVVLHR